MKRVTRNIDPESARDLLEQVPRACIAFASDHGPQAQPIVLVWHDGRYLAGIPEDADRRPGSGHKIVLLIDEGVHYFDLRAIYKGKLEAQHEVLLDIVQERFPEIASLARKQADTIEDPEVLRRLIVMISIVKTSKEAEQYLLNPGSLEN